MSSIKPAMKLSRALEEKKPGIGFWLTYVRSHTLGDNGREG